MHEDITVHMVVKNEDRFIWYALSSILPFANVILIVDTGSRDKTVEIIKSFRSPKIHFSSKLIYHPEDLAYIRQMQLVQTKTDWIWVVDGDEIYTKSLGNEISDTIQKDDMLEGIVVGRYDLMGDIYHHQSETVGTYNTFGSSGHYVLRLLNKKNIHGLHVQGIYPYEGYYDETGIEVLHHDKKSYYFTKGRLFHAMYLKRSSKGTNLVDTFHRMKGKIEWGNPFPGTQRFPEVFFKKTINIPSVLDRRSLLYEVIAVLITPIKILKRKIWGR